MNELIREIKENLEEMKKYQALSDEAEAKLEEISDAGEIDTRLERLADSYYRDEMLNFHSAAYKIESLTHGRITSKTARAMIMKYGDEILNICKLAA